MRSIFKKLSLFPFRAEQVLGSASSGGYGRPPRLNVSAAAALYPWMRQPPTNPKNLLRASWKQTQFFKSSLNNKGIALMLVMSAIVMLTMIAVEFAYNAQVEYQMAVHQKERLQAYYLANSGYNMTRLELKMGNAVQSQVAGALSQSGANIGVDLSDPLCQQFPIKTALFRLLMTGETGTENPSPKEGEEAAPQPAGEAASLLGGMPLSGLEEFLKFEGDFDSECVDESSKVDLNFIYNQNPTQPAAVGRENGYDQYKRFLMGILAAPQNEELIKKSDVKILEVVRNIADWVDPNEVINDFGGIEGGSEEAVYRNNAAGQMETKNGKFSIPDDIYMVEGVSDSWWVPLQDLFTIYGTTSQDGKPQINVCRAPNEVVKVLILRYTETRTDLPPLKAEDAEVLDQLVKAVQGGCTGAVPDKNKISQDLDAKLLEVLKAAPVTPPATGGTVGYGQATTAFADWIATQSRFFRLNLTGQVKDTVVKLTTVIDLGTGGGSDTTKWKTVYWKVE